MIPTTKYSKIIGILGVFILVMSSSYSWAYDLTFSCHQFEPYVIRIEKDKPGGVFVDIINAACSRIKFKCDVQSVTTPQGRGMRKAP